MFPFDEKAEFLSPLIDFHMHKVLAYSLGTKAKIDKMMTILTMLKNQHGKSIKSMMVQSDPGSNIKANII
jgi:hypothetical protein